MERHPPVITGEAMAEAWTSDFWYKISALIDTGARCDEFMANTRDTARELRERQAKVAVPLPLRFAPHF